MHPKGTYALAHAREGLPVFPLPVDEIPAADASHDEIEASIKRLKKSFVRYTK